jgi:hypothetical protein
MDYFQATMFRHPDATIADKWDLKTEQLMFSKVFTRTVKVYLKFWRLPWKMRMGPNSKKTKDNATGKENGSSTETKKE